MLFAQADANFYIYLTYFYMSPFFIGAYDPKVHDFADVMKVGFMTTDVLLMDEMNQVHGFVVLLDFT